MTALLLFGCTFGVVLALTLQALNVMGGHKGLAVLTSFGIGLFNLALFKLVPQPTDATEIAAYLTGGPVGVLVAMHYHAAIVRLAARITKAKGG